MVSEQSKQRPVFGADGDFPVWRRPRRRRGREDHLHDGGLSETARPVQGEGGGRKRAREGAAVRANLGEFSEGGRAFSSRRPSSLRP